MRTIVVGLLIALSLLGGCASSKEIVTSTNTDILRVGEEPAGYPKKYVVSQFGYCTEVTESWRKSSQKGNTIWLKNVERIGCKQ